MINSSLKEYYVKLQDLYNNAVTMLTAINQSLSSSSSEITLTISDGADYSTVRIPSFLYLENKLEQIDTNFNILFDLPKSGEAWLTKTSDKFKVSLLRANTAPMKPSYDSSNISASVKDNNILKDMVCPKTYLKINLSDLPEVVDKIFMKKLIIYKSSTFNTLQSMNLSSYDEYVAALYNLTKGVDYDEYDSVLNMPVKKDVFASEFKILEIPELTGGNPWYTDDDYKLTYKLTLDTLSYSNQEDSTIEYQLNTGDVLCLGDTCTEYIIKNVSYSDNSIIIEESYGHINLQAYSENISMILYLKNDNYNDYKYVEVPLEENQYICIFLGTIYENIRSLLSSPILLDLSTIIMTNPDGTQMTDGQGNAITYMDYYNKYCTNIGDLIQGFADVAYPQLSNYTNDILNDLENSIVIKDLVSKTIDTSNILQVVPINKHLIDDSTSENIINYHNQKNEINSQLSSLQSNIDNVYNTLVTTDFSQETTVTQLSLKSQLTEYNSQKTILQKQLIDVVNNINILSGDIPANSKDTKYRVRGITEVSDLETYLDGLSNNKIVLIGCEVEYKYKSLNKDTTTLITINSNTFTNWIKQPNIEKERYIVFNESLSSFTTEYENYSSTSNIIKWNQIDIPINQGEDVVLRIRYKYNVGQPFINLYSPWSDEFTMSFPAEYADNVEITSILDTNTNDVVNAKFLNTLISDGYQEHINNSITANNNTFYHMPDNIYSGFNTSENNMISLKDKLLAMANDIEQYKDILISETNRKLAVYLQYDNQSIELFNNSTNKINIYNNEHIVESFIKKDMNIVFKNAGDVPVKLYSIFSGAIDQPLLLCNDEFYDKYLGNYERVPLIVDEQLSYQTLGQWIYFRENNPYTSKDIYFNTASQQHRDVSDAVANVNKLTFDINPSQYMAKNNSQALLGYRKRENGTNNIVANYWQCLSYNEETGTYELQQTFDESKTLLAVYNNRDIDFFMYDNVQNNFLTRYEDIQGVSVKGKTVNLDHTVSLKQFINQYSVNYFGASESLFNGAFLYPSITGKTTILTSGSQDSYIEINPGETISVPIVFEYYLDGTVSETISKSLYFDIRDSLFKDPKHYMLELTAYYDYSVVGDILNSTVLNDELSE